MAEETTKVTLKVVTHAGDLGLDGKIGETVTVGSAVAARWIAAGIAEAVTEEEKPATNATSSRRSR